MNLLEKVLKLDEFKFYTETSRGDWRDKYQVNPSFSLSHDGWFDHKKGVGGKLTDLLPNINIKNIYESAVFNPFKVKQYFKTRKINITTDQIKNLKCKVNFYKEQYSILTPLFSKKGELIHLHRIQLDYKNHKINKSQLLGSNHNKTDRCISIKKSNKNFLIVEGFEDALTLQNLYPEHTILISCAANQMYLLKSFIPNKAAVTMILDNDKDGASLKYSLPLGKKVKRLIPIDGTDANKALQSGFLKKWHDELKGVGFDEVINANADTYSILSATNMEFNDKHAVVTIQGKVVVLNDEYDPIFKRWCVTFSSKGDFLFRYENKTVNLTNDRGDTKAAPAAKVWLASKNRRQYDSLCFDPSETLDTDKYFNVWRGFPYEAGIGNCSLYYEHMLNNVSGGNKEYFEYLLDWMADGIQNPTKKAGVAIIIRGGQGTGKGVFINWYRKLFGQHGMYIKDMSHLVGKFNSHLKECLLLFADEIFVTGDKAHEGTLKSLISEDVHMIEHKGKDAFAFPNYIRLMMSSNNRYVAPLDKDDRRYFILDIKDTHRKDYGYFERIKNQMTNENGLQQLMSDLLNRDLTHKNVKDFPATEAIIDNKIASFTTTQEWLFDLLVTGQLPASERINTLYDMYCKSCGRKPESKNQWSRELHTLLPSLKIRQIYLQPGRFYFFETLDFCRGEFAQTLNLNLDFDKLS